MRLFLVLLVVALAGCAGSSNGSPGFASPASDAALADVWAELDEGMQMAAVGDACVRRYGTYFPDFGVRGLACAAAQVVPATTLAGRAPVAPFRQGPHAVSDRAVRLDLTAENTFGHYDPVFVRWLVEAGVPDGQTARTLAQPVYDRHLARLARVYWLTHADLAAAGYPEETPEGALTAYAAYLDGGPIPDGMEGYEGGFAVYAFTDRSQRLLPEVGLAPGENEWEATYEANTAYGFWLRRRADGTHAIWHDGLRDLLGAFDAGWLAAHGG